MTLNSLSNKSDSPVWHRHLAGENTGFKPATHILQKTAKERPFKSAARRLVGAATLLLIAALPHGAGCQSTILRTTDPQVYKLIEDRQQAALGANHDAYVGEPRTELPPASRMYDFAPNPTPPGIPASFARGADSVSENADDAESPEPGATSDPDEGTELSPNIYDEQTRASVKTLSLKDALGYASAHARDLQGAKEELYRAALDLTLERHLWTPQFVATMSADYDDFEEDAEFDQAATAIADFAVTQRLPYGGDITARVVGTLVRELNRHTTTGESGQVILEAGIPLLRGAGRVAYESRYAAERGLIYAVRSFERFRRNFLVDVASEYFNLQQLKTAIGNTHKSYLSRKQAWEKAEFIERVGRSRTVFDAPRAKSIFRQAESALVSAKEQYASALDRFKIRIGMPMDIPIEVLDQESDVQSQALDDLRPPLDEAMAVEVALRFRLDLKNTADFVDDAGRGVVIAENAILPDLDLRGAVVSNSNPDHRSATTLGTERTSWSAGVELRMDDRKSERNAYRDSLISLRRAQRDLEEFRDTVRADVRRALRRIAQQENLLRIQALNVDENELRLAAAQAQFDLGRSTNQDVVDAEQDLLDARNDYARAVAAYRVAILELRRDTGTLRVRDDGSWDDDAPVLELGEEMPDAIEP